MITIVLYIENPLFEAGSNKNTSVSESSSEFNYINNMSKNSISVPPLLDITGLLLEIPFDDTDQTDPEARTTFASSGYDTSIS